MNLKLDRVYIERWSRELGILDLWLEIAGTPPMGGPAEPWPWPRGPGQLFFLPRQGRDRLEDDLQRQPFRGARGVERGRDLDEVHRPDGERFHQAPAQVEELAAGEAAGHGVSRARGTEGSATSMSTVR